MKKTLLAIALTLIFVVSCQFYACANNASPNIDYETIVITSKNGNVVMISEEEYNNMMENLYIMNNPAMRERLNHSIQQFANGETVLKTLDELKKEEADE